MFISLSYKIGTNTPMYGDKERFLPTTLSSIKQGDTANTAKWMFPNHIGTHIDLPYYFYENGQTVEEFPIDYWVFNGNKIQFLNITLPKGDILITPESIDTNTINVNAELLLFKTGFGRFRGEEKYWKNNPGIDLDTVEWIKKTYNKIRIIGLDSISISSWQHRDVGGKTHKCLLNPKNPILSIEDMDLSKINKEIVFHTINIAPLMIQQAYGTPCTIMAEVKEK